MQNPIPFFSVGAGSGIASRNMVNTGAMNESGQLMTWENSSDKLVPSAKRKIRLLAAADAASGGPSAAISEGITHDTCQSNVDSA